MEMDHFIKYLEYRVRVLEELERDMDHVDGRLRVFYQGKRSELVATLIDLKKIVSREKDLQDQ